MRSHARMLSITPLVTGFAPRNSPTVVWQGLLPPGILSIAISSAMFRRGAFCFDLLHLPTALVLCEPQQQGLPGGSIFEDMIVVDTGRFSRQIYYLTT